MTKPQQLSIIKLLLKKWHANDRYVTSYPDLTYGGDLYWRHTGWCTTDVLLFAQKSARVDQLCRRNHWFHTSVDTDCSNSSPDHLSSSSGAVTVNRSKIVFSTIGFEEKFYLCLPLFSVDGLKVLETFRCVVQETSK